MDTPHISIILIVFFLERFSSLRKMSCLLHAQIIWIFSFSLSSFPSSFAPSFLPFLSSFLGICWSNQTKRWRNTQGTNQRRWRRLYVVEAWSYPRQCSSSGKNVVHCLETLGADRPGYAVVTKYPKLKWLQIALVYFLFTRPVQGGLAWAVLS